MKGTVMNSNFAFGGTLYRVRRGLYFCILGGGISRVLTDCSSFSCLAENTGSHLGPRGKAGQLYFSRGLIGCGEIIGGIS